MPPFKRRVKKAIRKVASVVKRRYVKKGMPNMKNIIKDVKMLKALVNVEKKRVDYNFGGSYLPVAQYNGLLTGSTAADITPIIPEGITGSTRNGLSVKLTSCCIDLFFKQQTNTLNGQKVRWFFVCKPDNSQTIGPNTVLTQMLDINPFSLVIDYHSNRDPEYFTSLRIIKQGVITLSQDSLSTGVSFQQRKIPLRLNHHLKFNSDGSTTTTKNAFFMIFTADTGDRALASLTGTDVGFNIRYFYTDN